MSSAFQSDTANKSSLSESERQLQLVLDHSPDMMAFIKVEPGPVFRVVSINEKYLAGVRSGGFNLTREDLVGKTVEEVFGKVQASPELIKEMLSRYQRVVVTLQPHPFEEVVETPQGRYYGESLLLPGIEKDGRCGFIYYSSRDITERKLAEKKLQRLNRLYAVSSSINQAIVRIREVNRLYEQACRIAVEEGGLKMAWLGLLDPVRGIIKPVVSWGFDRGYTDTITISNKDAPTGRGPGGRAMRSGECAFSNDIANDENFAWRSEALDRGYRSCAVFPLKIRGGVTGFLAIYADQVNYFNEQELRLLNALAENISFAIESREQEPEKERMEKALRKNEEELRVTFENAGISIALVDNAGRVVKCNPALQKFLGYSEPELRAMSIPDITHPDDLQTDWSLFQELMEGKRDHYEIEKRYFHKNGEIKWGRLTVSLVRGMDQQPQYSIGMVEDVTEYKRSRAALRESEDRFRQLAENIQGVFWMASATKTEILYLSPAYEAIWGRTCESVYREPKAWLEAVHPEDRQRVAEAARTKQTSGEYDEEYRIVRPDGEVRWISDRGFPIKDESGNLYRIAGIAQDITRRKHAEQAVRESEARLQAVLDNSPNLIFMKDLEGRYMMVNREFEKSFHLKQDQIIGRTDSEFLPEKQAASYRKNDLEVLKKGMLVEFEETMENPHRISIVHKFPLRDAAGNIRALCGIATDITGRKLVEEQLRRNESLLFNTQRIARLGSWSYNFETAELEWSPVTLEIFKMQAGEFPGTIEDFLQMVHPEDRHRLMQAQEDSLCGGRVISLEYRIVLRDGSERIVQERGEVVCNNEGRPIKRVCSILDVTESRQREQKLREQAALLDKAQDAILVRNMEDVVLYWNKGAEHLYGYTASEAVGRKVRELIYKDGSVLDEARAVLLSKDEWHGEISQVTKDGRDVLVEARWTLMRDEQGQPHSVLAINTDITERKKLESQFLRAQRMESIGTLAGGIAHDLNNVLAPILMSCELLELEVKEPELRDVVTTIKTGAKRGAELVRQVLTFARGVEGRRLALQAKHLIHEVEQMMRETFPKSIQVRVLLSPDLPMVSGDPTQLHQVLLNLCVNARDAMPAGGQLTLRAESAWVDENQAITGAHSPAREYVVIRVADSGIGIPREIREKIFDPFFTTKEVGKGTGLGLSTTLAIVKSHDGFIHVASEPGRGSTFEVYLPAQRSAPGAIMRPAKIEASRGNGEMILLVDDEFSILKITKRTLERYGYRVLTAENGYQAISLYRQHAGEIAVVVTDMMMPLMDGPATIHALRSMNEGVKVIASSGLSTTDSVQRAREMGVRFLAKPYKAEALLNTLESLISNK